MSSSLRYLALLVALSAACDGAPGELLAEDGDGRFDFQLIGPAERKMEETGQLWAPADSDVRVTAQRVQVDDQVLRQRDPRKVADAIVTRYELGDADGTMSRTTCRLAGEQAECLVGSIQHEGTVYAKRLGVVAVGDEIVVLDVMAPMAKTDAVRRQWDLLERTLQLRGG